MVGPVFVAAARSCREIYCQNGQVMVSHGLLQASGPYFALNRKRFSVRIAHYALRKSQTLETEALRTLDVPWIESMRRAPSLRLGIVEMLFSY